MDIYLMLFFICATIGIFGLIAVSFVIFVRNKWRKPENRRTIVVSLSALLALFLLVAAGVVTLVYHRHQQLEAAKIAGERAVKRNHAIEVMFSGPGGRNYAVTAEIKKAIRNPTSFQHLKTDFEDPGGDDLIVRTVYRSRNEDGKIVIRWVKYKVKIDGNVVLEKVGEGRGGE